jgi:hypothetical protein
MRSLVSFFWFLPENLRKSAQSAVSLDLVAAAGRAGRIVQNEANLGESTAGRRDQSSGAWYAPYRLARSRQTKPIGGEISYDSHYLSMLFPSPPVARTAPNKPNWRTPSMKANSGWRNGL